MRAGQLRHFITVQQRADTRDSYGEPIAAWTTYAQVWASIEPISGREFLAAKEIMGKTTHRVRMRWLDGVTTKMRIAHGTRLFAIEAVMNLEERNVEMVLMCVESDV